MFSFEDKAKEKYYQKAEEKLREAGLDIFEVDRKQITVLKKRASENLPGTMVKT